jgi:chromosome segregation ATPase
MRWFVSRSRHGAALAEVEELRRRVLATEARHDEAEGERRRLADQLAGADAANRRVHDRNRYLTEQLETAREAAQDGALDEMGRRLDRALRACARYRVEGAEDRAAAMTAHQAMKVARDAADRARAAGCADVLRRLELSERARRDLDAQLAAVQKSNDFMCREAVDRAGTLAPTGAPTSVPKPSEVAW